MPPTGGTLIPLPRPLFSVKNFCKIAKLHIDTKQIKHLILKIKIHFSLTGEKSRALVKCPRKVAFSSINQTLMFFPHPIKPPQKLQNSEKMFTVFSLGFSHRAQSWRALRIWFCCNPFLQKFFYTGRAGGSGRARIPWCSSVRGSFSWPKGLLTTMNIKML